MKNYLFEDNEGYVYEILDTTDEMSLDELIQSVALMEALDEDDLTLIDVVEV